MRWSSRLWIFLVLSFSHIPNLSTSEIVSNNDSTDAKVRYDGHCVYRIRTTTPEEREIVTDFINQNDPSSLIKIKLGIDYVDVVIGPAKLSEFDQFASESEIAVKKLIDDVQLVVDQENSVPKTPGNFGWKAYHELDDIYKWLDTLSIEHPNLITQLVGGVSYEGRNIRGVRLSFGEGNPGVFLEGGIHAREWISPAVVTYVLNELITSKEKIVRSLVESYDWYVFPVYNPDGYVYTHTTERLWRKSRQPYNNPCVGVDLNRNWNIHWGETGASSNSCDEQFRGGSPFSEPESKTLSKFLTSIKEKLFAYIAFHSPEQFILIPYGFNVTVSNYDDLLQIGEATASALAKRYGTRFEVMQTFNDYPDSGSVADWVRGILNIPVTFTYELRDDSRYGVLLPSDQIIPSGEETLDALMAMLQESKKLGYGIRKC